MVGKPLEMLKQIAPSVVRVLSVLGRSRSISSFIVLKMLDLSNERLDRLLEREMRIGARRDGGDVGG